MRKLVSCRCLFAVRGNIWRIIRAINYFWLRKYAWIVVLGHYLFLEANSCPQASLSGNCLLLGTDNILGQLSVHISSPKVVYCLFIIVIIMPLNSEGDVLLNWVSFLPLWVWNKVYKSVFLSETGYNCHHFRLLDWANFIFCLDLTAKNASCTVPTVVLSKHSIFQ